MQVIPTLRSTQLDPAGNLAMISRNQCNNLRYKMLQELHSAVSSWRRLISAFSHLTSQQPSPLTLAFRHSFFHSMFHPCLIPFLPAGVPRSFRFWNEAFCLKLCSSSGACSITYRTRRRRPNLYANSGNQLCPRRAVYSHLTSKVSASACLSSTYVDT